MLLDELLSVGRAAQDLSRRRIPRKRVAVPSDALIVGVTSLHSHTFVPYLMRYRRIGHATVALVIDTSDLLPDVGNPIDTAARRIWLAQRDAERRALDRAGIPTALVTGTGGVGAAILSLRRRMNALLQPTRVGASTRWNSGGAGGE